MKYLLKIIFLLFFLFIGFIPSAKASEIQIEIPGFAVINYPSVVKIQNSACQRVNFNYEIDSDLDTDRSAIAISLGYIDKKKIIGGMSWFGTNISNLQNQLSMPLIGTLPIKVCKKSWSIGKEDPIKVIAMKPGTYDVHIGYGRYTEEGKVENKKSITGKIKFIK